MLKIFIPTLMLIPVAWASPRKWFWQSTTTNSLLIATVSLTLLKTPWDTGWAYVSNNIGTDALSSPLLVLSC